MTEAINLKAVGDIMLGDQPVCIGHGVRSTIEHKGFEFIKAKLQSSILDADIVFGNLESVLSNNGMNPRLLASAELRGRPEEATGLAEMGFNLINVANNHTLQHGLDAFNETVNVLTNHDIDVVGIAYGARCKVVWFQQEELKIAFLSYSKRPEKYYKTDSVPYAQADDEIILDHVAELREGSNMIIVLSLHWGEEFMNYPSKSQMNFAHQLVDAGVNLILGHHPHVLQGIEKYKESVIVYSLGNFIFDLWQRNPREAIIFSCSLSRNGLSNINTIPVLISRHFQPASLDGKLGDPIIKSLHKYSQALEKICFEEGEFENWGTRYQKLAEKAYCKFRMQSYLYFIFHIHKYKQGIILGSLLRFIKRRLSWA